MNIFRKFYDEVCNLAVHADFAVLAKLLVNPDVQRMLAITDAAEAAEIGLTLEGNRACFVVGSQVLNPDDIVTWKARSERTTELYNAREELRRELERMRKQLSAAQADAATWQRNSVAWETDAKGWAEQYAKLERRVAENHIDIPHVPASLRKPSLPASAMLTDAPPRPAKERATVVFPDANHQSASSEATEPAKTRGNDALQPADDGKEDDEPYIIEVSDLGCSQCGTGRTWWVIGPDGERPQTFDEEEDAQQLAHALNAAYAIPQAQLKAANAALVAAREEADKWKTAYDRIAVLDWAKKATQSDGINISTKGSPMIYLDASAYERILEIAAQYNMTPLELVCSAVSSYGKKAPTASTDEEKDQCHKYQGIVYAVCNALESLLGCARGNVPADEIAIQAAFDELKRRVIYTEKDLRVGFLGEAGSVAYNFIVSAADAARVDRLATHLGIAIGAVLLRGVTALECDTHAKSQTSDRSDFVIKACDVTAVATISEWIRQATLAGVSSGKIQKALAHLRRIQAWQTGHMESCKIPD